MPSFRTLRDARAVAEAAAQTVAGALRGGATTLALAGGTTPGAAYEIMAAMPDVTWGRVTILFGDERCVPPDAPESNYGAAFDALLARVRPATVHRIAGELGPDEAARRYDAVVAALAPLDLVLLGVGEDGHTASLFPGSPALEADGWATAVRGAPKPPPDRVSLTLGALRGARRVLVLATGAGKAGAVALARRGAVPAGRIEHAEWLIDEAAAGTR